ncbi:unnamed protein product [Caenorhabditis angaria]|uniref:Secreted protein n=1 Tax=Caenorhabditis angaria TaxID=860376 RepID=A0A9P1MRX7_9PELO|nr:unnamed protein product [Caenorhabditis angaria]
MNCCTYFIHFLMFPPGYGTGGSSSTTCNWIGPLILKLFSKNCYHTQQQRRCCTHKNIEVIKANKQAG